MLTLTAANRVFQFVLLYGTPMRANARHCKGLLVVECDETESDFPRIIFPCAQS